MKSNMKALFVAVVASSTALLVHAANDSPAAMQSGKSSLHSSSEDLGQRISFGEVPQPAKKIILEQSAGMIPKDVRSIMRNGTKYYSATFDHGQTRGRVTVAADGSVFALRESAVLSPDADLAKLQKSQISFNELPDPVQQRIHEEAGSARVGNVSQTRVNGEPLYRADFNRDGIRHELFITPKGTLSAQVQETTVAVGVRFDDNGNIVAAPGRTINEAAGAKVPSDIHSKSDHDYE